MIIASEIAAVYPTKNAALRDPTLHLLRSGQRVIVCGQEGNWIQIVAVLRNGKSNRPELIEGYLKADQVVFSPESQLFDPMIRSNYQ